MSLVQLEYMAGVILLFNISRHEAKFLQAGSHTPGALPGSAAYETALFQLPAYYVFSSVSLSSWHLVAMQCQFFFKDTAWRMGTYVKAFVFSNA